MKRSLAAFALLTAFSHALAASDRSWENPVFTTEAQALAAARRQLSESTASASPALRMFLDATLAAGEEAADQHASRRTVGPFLLSHPGRFLDDEVQRQTIERFEAAIPGQREIVEMRLARFGYPRLPGLVYLRLVDDVDAFSALNPPSSDQMSQVGGVTYYCRYIVLPLSYVGEQSLNRLHQSAALDPNLDVSGTISRWQSESFANLVNTFRHELVHVHTNSTLGVPAYADRGRFPTWFHEGAATYLSGDPRSGLSRRYRQYQDVFFFLVERHGVRKLQGFFAEVLSGAGIGTALREGYAITDSERLFAASSRWHRGREIGATVFWIALIAVLITAMRSERLPVIGSLMLIVALSLALALATGLAEHLWGLDGPHVVLIGKLILAGLAALGALRGALRVRRHWSVARG